MSMCILKCVYIKRKLKTHLIIDTHIYIYIYIYN